MKKEYYEKPEMEVIEFENEDIVTNSNSPGGAGENGEDGNKDGWQ